MSLLLGHHYSHETLSALTDEVLGGAEAFRGRLLPEEMTFVYLDGLSLKVLRDGEAIVRETVCVALGITPCGERQVLGFWLWPAESALGWEGVLGELWERNLRRVLRFITDGLPGLPAASPSDEHGKPSRGSTLPKAKAPEGRPGRYPLPGHLQDTAFGRDPPVARSGPGQVTRTCILGLPGCQGLPHSPLPPSPPPLPLERGLRLTIG